jgi:tetratricopeptide (TPR) repeat protein
MNRQQFINYIKSPGQLNAESLYQLENLVKEYPFFQTAESLLVLNLFIENNIRFNDQLKIASAYAADRKLLRHQLNTLQKSEQTESEPGKSETSTLIEEFTTKTVDGMISPDAKTLSDIINQLKNEVDIYMIQASDQKSSQQFANIQNLAGKLEKLIGSDVKPKEQPEKKKGTKRSAAIEYSLEHLEEIPVIKPKKFANADLIDKFINEEPRIVPKPTFFDPVDSAKHSLLDNESVVSETLAEIYYKQGNLAKAIKIYKKLSLVNPQKSSYFAALIEKIQKEIK